MGKLGLAIAISLAPLMLATACDDGSGSSPGGDSGTGDTGGGDSGGNGDAGAGDGGADSGPTLIDGVLLPDAAAAQFVAGVDNPLYPLPVGATWTYETETEDGVEHVVVVVMASTTDIMGVAATTVHDTATVDDVVIEDTTDWFAQDEPGNVWYLGEDTCAFEGGQCSSHAGSWQWGQDGALPGIIMPANPAVDGQPYFQEYYEGEAEDVGEVVALDQPVTVDAGSYTGCVQVHETSPVEPTVTEEKHYCPGIGLVLTEEPDAIERLISVEGLGTP